jgi:hypothetical protein
LVSKLNESKIILMKVVNYLDFLHSFLLILLLIFFIVNSYLREDKNNRLTLDIISLSLSVLFLFFFMLEFIFSSNR